MRRPFRIPGVLLIVGLIWTALALHSLSVGGVTWDEMLDFEGVNGAFWHGVNLLKGARPDLSTITFDLEYFGNATRWPTYLLWRLQMLLPWERITTLSRTQILLLSNYFSLNHLNAMLFALGGIGLTAGLASRLGGRRAGIFAGALLLLLPTWMGHGWMNAKDIPMATSYLLYTLGSTLLLRRERGAMGPRVVGLGLMAGSRVSSLVFIAISEGLLLALAGRRSPRGWLGSLAAGLLLGFLLTPQAWGDPLGYAFEAMRFISQRQGTGDSLAVLRYLATNAWDLLPSPLPLGLILLVLTAFKSDRGQRNLAGSLSGEPSRALTVLPTLLQLLIPQVSLILGGQSLYNELRHLLMIQPPLCVLAGLGYARGLAALESGQKREVPRPLIRALMVLGGLASLLLVVELLLLNPYQYTYRSDLARLFQGHQGPALRGDYWGFSGRETLALCLKRPSCAEELARRPLRVADHSLNPELIEASANLLRPPPDFGDPLVISTDPRGLGTLNALAETRRLTLLPQPRWTSLSAIGREPAAAGGP